MQSESPTDADGAAPGLDGLDGLDREQLSRALAELQLACAAAGCDVDALLAKPAAEVIEFAAVYAIDLRCLRELCNLLIQRLDSLDRQFAAVARLQSH